MKRDAERQITKDDDDDDDNEIEEIQDPQGFQKADETALAKRQIRALPKRALATSRPPSLNGLPPALAPDADKAETASQPKFAGFAGFGAGTLASNPCTFDTTFKPTPPGPTPNLPPIVPSFGAFRPSSSGSDASPPKPATPTPLEEADTSAFNYFKSLRGLNVSFLSAISAEVEKDPFFNVASLVESYKNLRTTIQSEFDGSPQPVTTRPSVMVNSTPLFGAKTTSEKTEKPAPFSMPKPPPVSVEAPSSTSESGTRVGGFTPFLPPPSSTPPQLPFAFTSKQSEPCTFSPATLPGPPKSAFTFGASSAFASTSSASPTSGLSFATSSSVENTTSKPAPTPSSQETASSSASPPSQPSSITPSLGSSSVPSFFSSAKTTSVFGTSDATSKPTSIFGGSIFGSGNTTEPSKPPPLGPSPDSKDSSKATTPPFGSATTTPSTSTSTFGSSSDKPVSIFGSASLPKTGVFAFGNPGGSIGNPVGFGFGSSAPSAGDTTAPGTSSSGFNFGAPSTKPSERLFSPPVTDKSTESTPQPELEGTEDGGEEDAPKLLPSHTHDEEGEGEEGEDTMHVVRCKVYRLSKLEDKSEWKDLGVGMFRLKKHKETSVRRVLMRNSNTGRILINFRIYGNLKPSLAKSCVSFIGYENSTPTSFRIRVKTEEQAGELKQAMEREIAAVQATE